MDCGVSSTKGGVRPPVRAGDSSGLGVRRRKAADVVSDESSSRAVRRRADRGDMPGDSSRRDGRGRAGRGYSSGESSGEGCSDTDVRTRRASKRSGI